MDLDRRTLAGEFCCTSHIWRFAEQVFSRLPVGGRYTASRHGDRSLWL